MKGIITVYLDRKEHLNSSSETVGLIKKYSPKAIEAAKEAGYPLMFVATTNEASRAEKVDFDKPFPHKPTEQVNQESLLESGFEKLCSLLEKIISKDE